MLKVECVDEVRHVLATPVDHLVRLDALVTSGSEPLLDKQNLGVVVRSLGEDTVTTSEWRDNVERQTDTWRMYHLY